MTRRKALALFASVFVIATCGLVYELLAGALASYLLGDTLLQFSTVIGSYLFAMGIGSWVSSRVDDRLPAVFVRVEALVGLIGGFSAAVLFTCFPYVAGFRLVLYGLVTLIGLLVGLEIPLLLRILKDHVEFKDLVAQVLTMDYLGALGASIAFPLLLVPKLGLLNTGFLFGLANVGVAFFSLRLFREELKAEAGLRFLCWGSAFLLAGGIVFSSHILGFAEANLYADDVILARSSPYQRIVLTRWKDDLRLFLNGNLQFSSMDEYRYHESLVHPALSALREPEDVLIVGGGDGLAAREVLRDPRVKRATLVDLDPEMTRLFRSNPALAELNGGSLASSRLSVVNDDAFTWLEKNDKLWDLVVVDFPDPSNYSVAKLFTTTFYSLVRRRLKAGGMIAVQATSPLFARRSYWCVANTIAAAGLKALPYHVYVPSFGEWGFVLGATAPYKAPEKLPAGLRYLTPAVVRGLFEFPPDMGRVDAPVNRLNTQILVQLYESEWSRIVH